MTPKFVPTAYGPADISSLSALCPTAKQENCVSPNSSDVDTQTWSPMNPHLTYPAEPLDVRKIPLLQPGENRNNAGCSNRAERLKPRSKWVVLRIRPLDESNFPPV